MEKAGLSLRKEKLVNGIGKERVEHMEKAGISLRKEKAVNE